MHPAMSRYKPLADRIDVIAKDVASGIKTDRYGYPMHPIRIPQSAAEVEGLKLELNRADQVALLIRSCLNRTEIECVNGVDKITVFFVHNGSLYRREFSIRGIYTMTWGKMLEILFEMEKVYAGP